MRTSKHELTDDPIVHRSIATLKDIGKTEKELIDYLGMVRDRSRLGNIRA